MDVKEILLDPIKTNEFIKSNEKLVIYVLNKICPQILDSYERDDYIQEGLIELYNAMHTFDDSKGIKFHTYAYISIKYKILRVIKNNKYKISLNKNDVVSFHIPIENTKDGISVELIDLQKSNIDVEYEALSKCSSDEFLNKINTKLMNSLTPNLQQVLLLLLENKKQSVIARELGFSREYIRLQVNKIKQKMEWLKIA